ncbi:MAG TPA: glutathione S-transferase family protein, partial [bacterium]|nr:glutathione S-transferase family protein [bacterium]
SYCHKVLIALYENETPFATKVVNLMDPAESREFRKISPFGKIPVLQDDDSDRLVLESSIIIEYLQQHYPGQTQLLPSGPEALLDVRLKDRLLDLYLHLPMQKVVLDNLRPAGKNDPYGVEQARETIRLSCRRIDQEMEGRTWAMGESFSLADCSAAPALFYVNQVMPLAGEFPHAAGYLKRLMQRPSYARVLREAEPYFKSFPGASKQ